jgi:hypothetical protein
MKKIILLLSAAILLVACSKENVEPTSIQGKVKALWSSSGRWASWTNGTYTVYNNVWGSGAGSQSLWVNSGSNWGVWANHPNTSGIKSYPNSSRYIGKKISSLVSCSSSFNSTNPSGGAWNASYDIWDSGKANEIMLWLNYTSNPDGSGNIKPISYNWNGSNPAPVYTNQYIGGHTWNVFRGNNGQNNVYSFLRTSKTNSGTVDVKAVLNWIKGKGWIGDVTVGDVQYGYEITSSYNNGAGMNFTTNSYSVSFQ